VRGGHQAFFSQPLRRGEFEKKGEGRGGGKKNVKARKVGCSILQVKCLVGRVGRACTELVEKLKEGGGGICHFDLRTKCRERKGMARVLSVEDTTKIC